MKQAHPIAIIGAGIAGLCCARILTDAGLAVRLFEKSRGIGGRLATRRVADIPGLRFDHGAQFAAARGSDFRDYLDRMEGAGGVGLWRPSGFDGPERFVGVPGMSHLAKGLAGDVPITLSTRILQVMEEHDGWYLQDEARHTHGPFAAIIVATPAPQAEALLRLRPALAQAAAQAQMAPCWAAMLAFDQALVGPDVYHQPIAPMISWAARDSSKPGRVAQQAWVIHAGPEWSSTHLDLSPDEALSLLTAGFAKQVGTALPPPIYAAAHRWRYALVTRPAPGGPALFDAGLGACGDWCVGGRIEAAFDSGRAMALRVLQEARDGKD